MAAGKDLTAALARANTRCKTAITKGEEKVAKLRVRARMREEAMTLGAIMGGMAAVAGPKVFPQAEEFLVQGITDKIKMARHALVGGGLVYLAYQSRDPFSKAGLAAAGGALLGRTAGELGS